MVFEYLERTCVIIGVQYGCGKQGVGTGNLIFDDGSYMIVLTCGHVVADSFDQKNLVQFKVNLGGRWEDASLITNEYYAETEELALLRVKSVEGNYNCVKLDDPEVYEGMPVHMTSCFTTKSHLSYTIGTVSRCSVQGTMLEYVPSIFVEYDISTGPGSSGASVVDSRARLVAVHVSSRLLDLVCENNAIDNDVRKTPCGLKHGIPHTRVINMIEQGTINMKEDVTLDERLYFIAHYPSLLCFKRKRKSRWSKMNNPQVDYKRQKMEALVNQHEQKQINLREAGLKEREAGLKEELRKAAEMIMLCATKASGFGDNKKANMLGSARKACEHFGCKLVNLLVRCYAENKGREECANLRIIVLRSLQGSVICLHTDDLIDINS